MDQEVPIHSNKKVILFALGAIGLIFLFLLISIFAINFNSDTENASDSQQVNTDKSGSENLQSDGVTDNVAEKSNVPDGWIAYKNSNFSINYPSGWEIEEFVFSNGKPGTNIRPLTGVVNSTKVNLTVGVESMSFMESFDKQQQMYRALGFKTSPTEINNIRGTKLSGSLSSKVASVSASQNTIQTTYIVLTKDPNIYTFDYTYVNTTLDTQLENTFGRIISTFKPLQ